MIIEKLTISILSLVVCAQLVQAAYNPFKTEAIKVTNILLGNANITPAVEFNNINTTALINTSTNVFSSATSNGIVCTPGTFLVDVVLYQAENAQRSNVSVEVTLDSVGTGITGASELYSSRLWS